jgi:hypothetical protein
MIGRPGPAPSSCSARQTSDAYAPDVITAIMTLQVSIAPSISVLQTRPPWIALCVEQDVQAFLCKVRLQTTSEQSPVFAGVGDEVPRCFDASNRTR